MKGIEIFRTTFAKHAEKYSLIGGMAAALLADESGIPFRATKDYDIVLIVEALDKGFFDDFWAFVKTGGYTFQKADGEKTFYRFTKPTAANYPHSIELFARKPDFIKLPDDAVVIPIPAGEDASSLSALLLNDDYYKCLLEGRKVIDGVPVLLPAMLVVFKANAHLELKQRKEAGHQVDQHNVNKHRMDVFRLAAMLSPEMRIDLPSAVKVHLDEFLNSVGEDAEFAPQDVTQTPKAETIARLKAIFQI